MIYHEHKQTKHCSHGAVHRPQRVHLALSYDAPQGHGYGSARPLFASLSSVENSGEIRVIRGSALQLADGVTNYHPGQQLAADRGDQITLYSDS